MSAGQGVCVAGASLCEWGLQLSGLAAPAPARNKARLMARRLEPCLRDVTGPHRVGDRARTRPDQWYNIVG